MSQKILATTNRSSRGKLTRLEVIAQMAQQDENAAQAQEAQEIAGHLNESNVTRPERDLVEPHYL
jgi:hypothetical protein